MRLNTIITLAASAVFGALAIWLSKGWINDAMEARNAGTATLTIPAFASNPAPALEIQTASILIADRDLNFGDPLTAMDVRLVDMPENFVPAGAITNLDDLIGDGLGKTVVLSRMAYNEPVMAYKISGPGGRGSVSSMIAPGMRAIAIRVDESTGVGGLVVPGDYVDVILTRDLSTNAEAPELVTSILAQNLKVLGINQNISTDTQDAEVASTVTLEASIAQSQKLNLGSDAGRLALSLRPLGETSEGQTPQMTASVLGSQPRQGRRAAGNRPAASPKTPTGVRVTIIRNDERESVSVTADTLGQSDTSDLAGGAP